MKNTLMLLVSLIFLNSCQKESQTYIDNAWLDQNKLTVDSVELTTCKHGTLTFPNPSHGGYNPAMRITFTLNPNTLISTSPIEGFSCDTLKTADVNHN